MKILNPGKSGYNYHTIKWVNSLSEKGIESLSIWFK